MERNLFNLLTKVIIAENLLVDSHQICEEAEGANMLAHAVSDIADHIITEFGFPEDNSDKREEVEDWFCRDYFYNFLFEIRSKEDQEEAYDKMRLCVAELNENGSEFFIT